MHRKQLFVSFKRYLLKLTASSRGSGVSVTTHHNTLFVLTLVATSFMANVKQTVTGWPFPHFCHFEDSVVVTARPLIFIRLSLHRLTFNHKLHNLPTCPPTILGIPKQTARKYFVINRLRVKPLVQSGVKQLDAATIKWRYFNKARRPKTLLPSLCDCLTWLC